MQSLGSCVRHSGASVCSDGLSYVEAEVINTVGGGSETPRYPLRNVREEPEARVALATGPAISWPYNGHSTVVARVVGVTGCTVKDDGLKPLSKRLIMLHFG
jgi:hypothetical protein